MISQLTMYPAKINSVITTLSAGIDIDDVIIPITDITALPSAPNLITIGGGANAETVLYTDISGSNLTGCTRAFQGVASIWTSGTSVWRAFTAYDHDTFKSNIEDLNNNKSDKSELDNFPFKIKSAFYSEMDAVISVLIASGTGETFNGTTINTITKTSDTIYTISTPLASTTYTIYLKNDGNFASSTDGSITTGSILIGTVLTNADKSVNTIVDKRPLVSGVGSELVRHKADLASHKGINLKLYRLNKDSEGIFTELQWKRTDDTLAIKSVLSGGTTPKYTTRTETYYENNGTTVKATKTYTISYNTDDEFVSEV